MSKKETIKLFDFLTDAIKAGGWDIEIPQPETYFTYECPDGKRYDESVKYSPETGKEIIKVEHTREAEYDEEHVRDIIYYLESNTVDGFDFKFIDSVEKRQDDCDGYFNHHIFQRLSDGKYFYYCMYEGRVENNELEEAKKVVVESWDFEKYFM